jgi:hypothetical protein
MIIIHQYLIIKGVLLDSLYTRNEILTYEHFMP